jgi:hypothetical protein
MPLREYGKKYSIGGTVIDDGNPAKQRKLILRAYQQTIQKTPNSILKLRSMILKMAKTIRHSPRGKTKKASVTILLSIWTLAL